KSKASGSARVARWPRRRASARYRPGCGAGEPGRHGQPARGRTPARWSRIPWYVRCVSATTRITVTLPSEQVAALKEITDNVSGSVAEAVARQIRHRLLVDELERHQSQFGAFTPEELAQARAKVFGGAQATADPAA